jgi:CPA2 family monovalent cation:H+ antiporter-2
VTLGQLAVTVATLGVLGLAAGRFGLSAIPAYLLAGILIGPNTPETVILIEPSEVTAFLAELGIVFLLFFLGLEFSFDRLLRSGRHVGLGGGIDLAINGALGLAIGVAAFGLSSAAFILAASIYVSSSAVAIKGLIDFRRLADDETDLVLAILVFEDIAIAFALAFAAGGGGGGGETALLVARALAFIGGSVLLARLLTGPIDRLLDRLPREFFLLFVFAFLVGMAALAEAFGLSEAIGGLMAGVVLAETSVREQIEERFYSFRDLFAALFFFVFGLEIEVGSVASIGWLLAAGVAAAVVGKLVAGYLAGRVGGFTRRQSVNVGAALVAHGEFTIILAQLAAANAALSDEVRADLAAFSGLFVLVTATLGVILMKESKRAGRRLFPSPARPVPRTPALAREVRDEL